jgi:tetratricopeptide (TPR) repeat protein
MFKLYSKIPCCLIAVISAITILFVGSAFGAIESPDRAVVIAKKSRDRVERNGKILKASSNELFQAFAERTEALQELIDTHKSLESAGLLKKNDPDGRARRAHINARILLEVGELKKACDINLDNLIHSLNSFDKAVATSLLDSQATRAINSNHELAIKDYLRKEKQRFQKASEDAEKALDEYQSATDPRMKQRLKNRYMRAKKRLHNLDQQRKRYETRMKIASKNQQITGLIREKIRNTGNSIPDRFRDVLADLYTTFAKVVPVAEAGGTGTPELWENLGFQNLEEMSKTLDIVGDATGKLNQVLDAMVDDVLAGLGQIEVINDSPYSGEMLSVEEEMEFINKTRMAWAN